MNTPGSRCTPGRSINKQLKETKMAKKPQNPLQAALKASGLKYSRVKPNPGNGGVGDRRTVGTMGCELAGDADGGFSGAPSKPKRKRS
jgi:hypothetical protein